ncbi:MAG: hypothetical protein AAF493_28585, partial [Pseudomonadota bacterium]
MNGSKPVGTSLEMPDLEMPGLKMPGLEMSRVEIATSQPEPLPVDSERGFEPALARARTVMQRLGLNDPSQQMGTRWPIGCVAVEITQRCNLDCT